MLNEPVSWPLPSRLRFPTEAALTTLEVEVHLLDGQLIRGVMAASENLSELSELKLLFRGQPLALPVSDIRSVERTTALMLDTDAGIATSAHGQHVEHEEALIFHVLFVDGKTLDGETTGYVNRKTGGVYLYVRQEDLRFKALWIPRHSLQRIRIDLPDTAIALRRSPELAGNMDELAAMLEESRGKPLMSLAQALHALNLLDKETFHQLQAGNSDRLRTYIDSRLATSDLSELQLDHARAYMLNIPEINADTFKVASQALSRISWAVAARHSAVPLGMISGTLCVAAANPMSRELQDRLGVIAGCSVTLVWAAKAHIDARIARESHTQVPQSDSSAVAPVIKSGSPKATLLDVQSLLLAAMNEITISGSAIHSDAVDERSSVVLLVKRMILDAQQQKASDIHIETNAGDESSRVRFRKDGDLEDYLQLPPDLRAALVSRIKVMSKLDISERRRPQDGKINFADFSDIKLELRVAILPTHDNLEDVVMRLLASSKPIPLAQLGFSARDADIVKRLAQRPYGLLLACGPTGSGKTTTLHSLLSEINTDSRKIWTAEDPIEITQPGLRQLQVNPKIGLTFASAMRAFLRADPDVIMVGEVRDEETARVCVEASLTGHLVLSTLHTNGAAESVIRLLDLGMDPMNFGDSLIGIVAQRLVRGLCKHCAVSTLLSSDALDALVHEYVDGTALPLEEGRKRLIAAGSIASGDAAVSPVSMGQAVGCDRCGGRGYKGRMGIYEVLENVGDMKHKIQTRAPTSEIFAEAASAGMRTLRQDALEKVVAGLIDLTQARTVYA